MNEIAKQFNGFWPMFFGLVKTCDNDAWLGQGLGHMVPARIAIHIPTSLEFYLERDSDMRRQFEENWTTIDRNLLPGKNKVIEHADEVRASLDSWLMTRDPQSSNNKFPWTGTTVLGTAIFMLRHSMYHIGELNCLHYLNSEGTAGDPWMGEF